MPQPPRMLTQSRSASWGRRTSAGHAVAVSTGSDGAAELPTRRLPAWRREGSAFVELLALTGFAVAQPVLDIFGRAPTQFVFRQAQRLDILVFALAVTFALPVALLAVEALVGLVWPAGRRALHYLFAGVLIAAFTVQAARGLVDGAPLFAAAAVVGTAGAVLCYFARAARLWLRFASVAPAAFLALFLFTSDAALLLSDASAQPADAEVGSPAPVVMLVFDEFPLAAIMRTDGTIDEELYPNIAALAGRSNWFRNTTAVSSSTWYALPSVVTGRFPEDGTAPVAASHPESLFTLLGDSYDLDVTESVTRLCPEDLCTQQTASRSAPTALLADAVGAMKDRLSYSGESGDATADLVEQPTADEGGPADDPEVAAPPTDDPFADFELNQPDRFRTFVDGVADGSTSLHYLHILLPHVPYRYLPSGARYEPPDPDLGRSEDQWVAEPWFPTLARQRLQLQLSYVDTLVGQLVSTLEQRDAFDESLIVMTADHGISFQAGEAIRAIEGQPLNDRTVGELAWVPLIVKTPDQQRGVVSDANVLTVDVLPTIADVLDVDVPWPVDGRSALGPERPDNVKPHHGSDVNAFGVQSLAPVDIDGEAGWRSVTDAAVDRFFAADSGSQRIWQIGIGSELVGTSIDAAPDATIEPVDFTLADPDEYELSRTSRTVPALVRGSVDAEHRDELLAIAVNGVIGAVGPAYPIDAGADFAVMVDDELFRPGTNVVEVFRLST